MDNKILITENGIEKRQSSSYEQGVIDLILEQAGVASASSLQTAALETAAGFYSRAFAMAEPSALPYVLTPECLGFIGRELIRRGEACLYISVVRGMIELIPASSWVITGGSSRKSWRYQLTLQGASTTATLNNVASASVVHVQFGISPENPWRGIGPLQFARLTGRLSAELETALGDEASGPRGSFLPTSKPGSDSTMARLREKVYSAKGKMLAVESQALGHQGSGPVPSAQDWQARRFGAEVPTANVALFEKSFIQACLVCGIPAALVNASSSAATKEAHQVFVNSSVKPLARKVAAELTDKLDREITLGFGSLRPDMGVAARARAAKMLREAFPDATDAEIKAMAGLE